MIVHNKTKSIRTFPVDHMANQVVAAYPGWSEIPDSAWFTTEVTLTDEIAIKNFGKVVKHGAEIHASGVSIDQIEALGEVEQKDKKAPRKSLGLADMPLKKAKEIIEGCNRSDTLKAWQQIVGEELRIAIANRLDDLKESMKKGLRG